MNVGPDRENSIYHRRHIYSGTIARCVIMIHRNVIRSCLGSTNGSSLGSSSKQRSARIKPGIRRHMYREAVLSIEYSTEYWVLSDDHDTHHDTIIHAHFRPVPGEPHMKLFHVDTIEIEKVLNVLHSSSVISCFASKSYTLILSMITGTTSTRYIPGHTWQTNNLSKTHCNH
jgi:hypothetical protein